MSWTTQLAEGVKTALKRGSPCRVAVHSEAQAELGKIAARRLAPEVGGNADDVSFEIISERKQDIYPVGAILA